MEKFSSLEYRHIKAEEIEPRLTAFAEGMEKAESYVEMKRVFLDYEALMEELETYYSTAYIRNTIDTTDKFYEGEVLYYGEAFARLTGVFLRINHAIAESRFTAELSADFGSQIVKNAEVACMVQTEKNADLMVREEILKNEYSKVAASCKVEFMGKECNFYGLLAHMESTDRAERKAAFEEWAKLYEGISEKLDSIYDELVSIRVEMAKNAGYDSFLPYIYLSRGHYDWTLEDCKSFKRQVKEIITPAVNELYSRQAKRLGVDKLHIYDEKLIFPEGNAKPTGTPEEMVAAAGKMYNEISPETGEFFAFMREHELFDLLSKPGKHLGGYMTSLPLFKAPFIFSNFNGTSADIDVLTHEAGHAFQYYLSSRIQPIAEMCGSTSDINEIHSMTMEHFAYPYMSYFCGENADKYRSAHLFGALETIPYLVSVDEFQQKVFENPTMTAADRRALWKSIEEEFMPWRDYDGNEFLSGGGYWMQKQHIFLYPFYYVEYALSQICAFQYYTLMKKDRHQAFSNYLDLCRAGGSKGYLELLKTGSLESPFADGTVKKAVSGVIEELNTLFK